MVEIFDNIRKIYHFRAPCAELANYIEFFSESSAFATNAHIGNDAFTVKMFPSYTPTFWINLGANYQLTLGNNRYFIAADEDVVVTRDTIAERHNLPNDHIFTVKLYPGALETVLGIDQSKLTGKLVSLQEILPAHFLAQIKAAKDFEARIDLFEEHFLSQMKIATPRAHYTELVRKTIAVYTGGNMQYNVDELSARMFVTSKTINRYFNKVIGITPKNYLSIIRARTALMAYLANKQQFSPCNFGYHDMSHFYKEAIKFTGQRMPVNHS